MLNLIVRLAQTIPPNIQEQGEEIVEKINSNPPLKWALLGIGAFCALVFLFGILKHAFKAALLFAILSVGAWVWYFNVGW
jgi:hypothetical protein